MARRTGILPIGLGLLLGLVTGPASASAAVFVVTDTGDPAPSSCLSGVDCSLREAIAAANASMGPDTVQLSADVSLSIAGSGENLNATGDLDVASAGGSLTIQGTGSGRARILQTTSDRVLDSPVAGPDLTLKNVTAAGGTPPSGGGGGINFQGGSTTLTLDNAGVAGNTAPATVGGGVRVGGSSAHLSVINGTQITSNHGATDGGGIGFAAVGGGISVTGSEISGNESGGTGGGVYADSTQSFQLTLNGATIDNNEAGDPATGQGGGVYVITEGGTNTANITNGTISSNSAGGGGGLGSGGGVFLTEFDPGSTVTNSMTIAGTILDQNTAGGEGGAGSGFGGGISTAAWDLTLTGATVSDNEAGVSADMSNPTGFGGGISASGEVGEDLEIQASLLTGNQAGETSGSSGEGGGGLLRVGPGNMTISDSAFTGNSAGTGAGTESIRGGGIYRAEIDGGAPSDVITRTTISGNHVTARGAAGGGLAVATTGSITIDRTTVSGNTATGESSSGGGGIYVNTFGPMNQTATLVNSTVHGNHALATSAATAVGGGGIYANTGSGPLKVTHSTITANEADPVDSFNWGGNIYSTTPMELRATIIAGGIAGDPLRSNCNNLSTQFNSLGENLEDTAPSQCSLDAAGDQVGVNPLLGSLALNGASAGAPLTRALLTGSPALDSVPTGGLCPAVDQRGVVRPQGSACDVGAFELSPVVTPPPAPAPPVAAEKPAKCKKGFAKKKAKGKTKCVKKKPKS